ncbi:hypothetical protein [Methylorubrum thiocyanatum]|uniref:hypothetical protein n=1 Tax=Methylorubrum thiocyanatum TaxID=47958 RepID=UPI00398C5AB1
MAATSAPACASVPLRALVPARLIEEVDVVAMLRAGVDEAGSQRVYAARHGLNANDLSSVLGGRRAPSASMLRAVGARRALVMDGGAA